MDEEDQGMPELVEDTDSDDGFGRSSLASGILAPTAKVIPAPQNLFSRTVDRDLYEHTLRAKRLKESTSKIDGLLFPWERNTPTVASISSAIVASVPATLIPPLPPPVPELSEALSLPAFRVPFTVRKLSKFNWIESEDLLRQRAHTRWRAIIESDLQSSQLGLSLVSSLEHGDDEDEIKQILNDVFNRKSTATLVKRAGDLLRYMKWARSAGYIHFMRITERSIYAYLGYLHSSGAAPSTGKNFLSSLRFAQSTIGLHDVDNVFSPRVTGSASRLYKCKAPLKQAVPLTVPQVKLLENAAINAEDEQTKAAAGMFCMALYSCCRFKDAQFVRNVVLDMPSENFGYVECKSTNHKTATTDQKKTTFLPIVAFARGLLTKSWARSWVKVRADSGLETNNFLLPAPLRTGGWSSRPLTSGEGAQWLRGILAASGASDFENKTAHSLKVTLLSWAAKSHMSLEDRRILGHHMDAPNTSALTYSRDALAGPLERMEAVLESVRDGSFDPDSSRATRAYSKIQARSSQASRTSSSAARGLTAGSISAAATNPEEPEGVATEDAYQPTDGDIQLDSEESDSSSSGSEDMSEPVDDSEEEQLLASVGKDRQVATPSENLYISRQSGLGHLLVVGHPPRFKCGKLLSAAYRQAKEARVSTHMCLVCSHSKQGVVC